MESKNKSNCESCDEIDKIEHLVEEVFPAFTYEENSRHPVKMKSLPKEGDLFKMLPCYATICFFCTGNGYGIPVQEQYDANKMYTDLLLEGKRDEMRNEVIHNWDKGSDAKEIVARYKNDIPIIRCLPI